MNNQSLDIQASYQIIQLLEKSKQNSESVIENLPDIYLVIDEHGCIYKTNSESCRFLQLPAELSLGYSLVNIVAQETWNHFSGHIQSVKLNAHSSTFEFSLLHQGTERTFLWTISRFGSFKEGHITLYSIQARDITLLRLYQKKINDIFSSIPLGIFTVNSLGLVDDAFSEYTRWILGLPDIAGKTLNELLYVQSKEWMDAASREGFKSLMNSIGKSVRDFDLLSETFPKQFYYYLPHSTSTKGRYLGMKVQSIAKGEFVSGLLVILEDRTLIVEAEKADEKGKLLQDQSIERALQLKKADPELLEVVMSDLKDLMNQLGDCVMTQTSDSFKNVLHSVKSNARLVGFSNLQKLSHAFESRLREDDVFSWETVYSNIEPLMREWREIASLKKALEVSTEDNQKNNLDESARSPWKMYLAAKNQEDLKKEFENYLKSISFLPLTHLESSIHGMVSTACTQTGKKAKVLLSWDREKTLDIDLLSKIRICFNHIICNIFEHGIETVATRIEKGKGTSGIIHIGSLHSRDGFILFIEDDGAGLNAEEIRQKIVQRGILSKEHASLVTENEIFDFLFYPGFSTKTAITESSGRGVGLSAVREICQEYSGNCKVMMTATGRTRFELHFSNQEEQ